MDTKTITNLALASRIGFGVASWVAPEVAFRPFGVRLGAGDSTHYITRLFGSRDVALGALGLATSGADRRRVLAILCAADTIDCAAAMHAGRKGGDVTKVAALGLVLGGLVVLVPQLNELLKS